MYGLTKKKIQANREELQRMWERIPEEWVSLDVVLEVPESDSKAYEDTLAKLTERCDGPTGPHNECGAVGCFLGWNWTNYKYRTWCKRYGRSPFDSRPLNVWLGLSDYHDLYDTRNNPKISQKEEVNQRIATMIKMPIMLPTKEA